mmetsp:Transcript_24274/g.95543  ORF Transcript_24274/g.95543 Transcript_24274/m.95543 type:complete len:81 (+) Transcript_24274:455-697(+)
MLSSSSQLNRHILHHFVVVAEFVQLLSSGANEVCEKESKKTITPEHVLKALMELGLGRKYSPITLSGKVVCLIETLLRLR